MLLRLAFWQLAFRNLLQAGWFSVFSAFAKASDFVPPQRDYFGQDGGQVGAYSASDLGVVGAAGVPITRGECWYWIVRYGSNWRIDRTRRRCRRVRRWGEPMRTYVESAGQGSRSVLSVQAQFRVGFPNERRNRLRDQL